MLSWPPGDRWRWKVAALLFVLGAALFSAGPGDREFIGFESRFGLFAKEMMRSGFRFFPTVYGEPYPDYPSTQTVLVWLASRALGGVTVFTAVLPTALFAAATLALTFLAGSRRSLASGACAALLLTGTYEFLAAARAPSADQVVATCAIFTFLAATSTRTLRPGARSCLIASSFVVGFAFRGPIGLVLPASVLAAHQAAQGEWRRLGASLLASLALLALSCGGLLLAAYREGGEDLVRAVTRMQSIGRLVREDGKPFYYYLGAGFGAYAASFPLAMLFLVRRGRSLLAPGGSDRRELRSLACWLLVVVVGLSIPMAKKARYLLPVAPAAALLAAELLRGPCGSRRLRRCLDLFVGTCGLLPLAGLAGAAAAPLVAARLGFELEFPATAAASFGIEALAILFFARRTMDEGWRTVILLGAGAAALLTAQVLLVEPIQARLEATRPFVEKVEALRGADRALVFYRMGPDAGDVKYMVNAGAAAKPRFASSPAELAAFTGPAVFVAEKKDVAGIGRELPRPSRTIAEGKVGRRDCVAFVLGE